MKKVYMIPVSCILIQLFVSGCAVAPKITEETIIKIYADEKARPKEFPVIFIPGIFGTVLKKSDTGQVVWGKPSEDLVNELALPIENDNIPDNRDQVVPEETIEKFSWIPELIEKDIYAKAKRVAVNAAGYTAGETLFSLSYDWRRDFVEGARRLGALIDRIKREKGKPDLKFDIVCHSAGGLIARYYAKYGAEDVLERGQDFKPTYAGAGNINKIIMLGTPNRGSLESFRDIHEGLTIPGIGRVSSRIVFTMPSAFELMPIGDEPVFVDAKGNNLDISLYEPSNWEKYGWSVFASDTKDREKERRFLAAVLKRARAFQNALWSGDPYEERRRVTYIILGSDANPTLDKALLQKVEGGWILRFHPHDDTLSGRTFIPGDKSVTRKSLLGTHIKDGIKEELPSAYEIFFAQDHVDLAGDPTFLDNILHSLLDKENDWKSVCALDTSGKQGFTHEER